jgi:hypothetical protein
VKSGGRQIKQILPFFLSKQESNWLEYMYSFVVVTFFFAIPGAAVIGIFALVFGQATLTIICVINHKKNVFFNARYLE